MDRLTVWHHCSGRERFYGDLISPATIKRSEQFMWSARYFCPTVSEFEFSGQILIEVSNIKFEGYPPSGNRPETCGQTDGRTDGNDDGKRRHHHDNAPIKKSGTRDHNKSNGKRRFSLMATTAILKPRVLFSCHGPICKITNDEILPWKV